MSTQRRIRLAIVVTHPIQYVVPLYRRLAEREDVEIKVFYTRHAGEEPVEDSGFGMPVKWDIPLTDGYSFEVIPDFGAGVALRKFRSNSAAIARLRAWGPNAVHVSGWRWPSHLQVMRFFSREGIPVLFRGDSHLLDAPADWRWPAKRRFLQWVYSHAAGFLVVGAANRAFYDNLGIPADRLFPCPHSIDVQRFAEPAEAAEAAAREWRRELAIPPDALVLVFAGKFERKKRPVELMRAVQRAGRSDVCLITVGNGELEPEIRAIAAADPERFRVLPFQNQTRMPMVYRLGDLFVLPSAYGETWGLAVNEAMASSRPVLVSDRVGCAGDLVDPSCGWLFEAGDLQELSRVLSRIAASRDRLSAMGVAALGRAKAFDIADTEATLMSCLKQVTA